MSDDLLLDTNMLLWLVRGDQRASWLQRFVEDDASTITVSAVVLTEVAIKSAVGKLPDQVRDLRAAGRGLGMIEIGFGANHAEQLATLPMHHRDPFDRMLIAQALSEDYLVATSDRTFARYEGVRVFDGR